jgi:hypothetical protein
MEKCRKVNINGKTESLQLRAGFGYFERGRVGERRLKQPVRIAVRHVYLFN